MEDSSRDDFRQKTIAGISWSVVSKMGSQIMRFVIGIILARLLSPEAYGLIGMIVVFTGFAELFIDMGFGAALIQKQDTTPKHYDTVFWLNAGVGLLLTGAFMAGAPLIANFYDEALLVPLTLLISANFFIGSLGIIQLSRFKKALAFKKLAVVDLATVALAGAVGIAMALSGGGVWSLAVQNVVMTFSKTGILWMLSDWRPHFRWSRAAVADLFGFSAHLLGFKTINYWARNADYLLIGRFLSSAALGIYTNAYKIMLLPVRQVSSTIGRVMFPAFSSIQHDRERVAQIYLRITRTIALVSFPLMAGLAAVADHFVLGVLGAQWRPMIPILQIFCFVGLVQSISTLNGNLYQSQGRTDLQFKVGGIVNVTRVGAIVLGLQEGIVGVAVAYSIHLFVVLYPSLRIPLSLVELTFGKLVENLAAVFFVALAMGGMVWGVGSVLSPAWSPAAVLAVQVPLGMVVFWALVHSLNLEAYRDTRALLVEQWHRRFAAEA